jgi:hypothetical protein
MKNKRSRLALLGVLALAISLTVGLTAGVAEAQKKGKKGRKAKPVKVVDPATHILPPAVEIGDGERVASQAIVTLNTPNKATKGKAISPDSVTATYNISGVPPAPPAFGGPGFVGINLQHRGREVGLPTPFDGGTTLIGTVTASPNSNVAFCVPDAAPPPPPCTDPAFSCQRPYACTVQANQLTVFGLTKAKGPFIFRLLNFGQSAVTISRLSVTATLKIVPGLE